MKFKSLRFHVVLSLIVSLTSTVLHGEGGIHAPAITPPLGFNSFDSYHTYLSEDKAYALVDVMSEKYRPFGYEYFVIDAGWARNVELYPGTMYPKKTIGVAMDEYGLVEPCQTYFPHGIKAVADYCHKKGLKFGVWIIRGIPREAVDRNLPIKGTPYFARDIADTSSICSWNQDNYGVDMSKPGAQAYYNALVDKLAGWGVDFIKVDDVVPNPREIVAVAKAIENSGHKLMYSLSPGDEHHSSYLPHYKRANMLRITADIWDNALSIERGFAAWEKFQGAESPGFWPDLDMIPFGRLNVVGTDDVPNIPQEKRVRQSLFTQAQMKTFITQRSLAASPLIIGGDLLTMDDVSYRLLTNPDMLECNQNGVMGIKVYRAGDIDVWFTPNAKDPSRGWVGVFNRSKSDRKVTLTKQDLGFVEYMDSTKLIPDRRPVQLKDVWSGGAPFTITDDHTFDLPADGVAFLQFQLQ